MIVIGIISAAHCQTANGIKIMCTTHSMGYTHIGYLTRKKTKKNKKSNRIGFIKDIR